jgi:hypothetical protein
MPKLTHKFYRHGYIEQLSSAWLFTTPAINRKTPEGQTWFELHGQVSAEYVQVTGFNVDDDCHKFRHLAFAGETN